MSSHNVFPLFYKENLAKRPQDFVVNEDTVAEVDRQSKERRKNAPVPVPTTTTLRVEYNSLRRRLFELEANARSLETKTNDLAGKVHLLEQRLSAKLAEKKRYTEANNLLGERHCEHAAQALETEIADAVVEFENHKRYAASAFRELRNFAGHARLAELRALFESDGETHPQAHKVAGSPTSPKAT